MTYTQRRHKRPATPSDWEQFLLDKRGRIRLPHKVKSLGRLIADQRVAQLHTILIPIQEARLTEDEPCLLVIQGHELRFPDDVALVIVPIGVTRLLVGTPQPHPATIGAYRITWDETSCWLLKRPWDRGYGVRLSRSSVQAIPQPVVVPSSTVHAVPTS